MAHIKLPSVVDDDKLLPFLKPIVSQQGELGFPTDLLQYSIGDALRRVCYPFPILQLGLLLCLQDTFHTLL